MSEEIEFDDVAREELLKAIMGEISQTDISNEVTEALKELVASNPDIEVAIVSSAEGLPVAWYSASQGASFEEGTLAGSINVIFMTSERNSMNLNMGHVDHIIIKTEEGNVIITLIGEDHILGVVTNKDAKLGAVRMDINRVANKISEIIEKARAPTL